MPTLVSALPFTVAPVAAQIVTDGTVGPHVALSGSEIEIGADLGSRHGANLFHSFRSFNVNSGQGVTFTGSADIASVISRVTGGTESRIDGTLRSRVGAADFYFINPAGMVFGPNAVVDVPAELHVSTADELRFADGTRFSASDPSSSSLSVAPPEAFGFLRPSPAAVSVEGSRIAVAKGQTVSLAGGEVRLTGGSVTAPSGRVNFSAVAGPAEVPTVAGRGPAIAGTVALTKGALVGTSGDGGGTVRIRGGRVLVDNSGVEAINTGPTDAGGGVDVAARSVEVTSSYIATGAQSSGRGGTATVEAGTLSLQHGGQITSLSAGSGDAGAITVRAGSLFAAGDSESPFFTGILGDAVQRATGRSADISVTAGDLRLQTGAVITSNSFGSGAVGSIAVQADTLDIMGGNAAGLTGIFQVNDGPTSMSVGGINVTAGRAQVRDGGRIESYVDGRADAGTLTLKASDLTVTGSANPDLLTRIATNAFNTAVRAGDVQVQADSLTLTGNASIGSSTQGTGNAGAVSIEGTTATLTNVGARMPAIFSEATESSAGNAGNVHLSLLGDLTMRDGHIRSNVKGSGIGGNVTVQADRVLIEQINPGALSAIYTYTETPLPSPAGDVKVTAHTLDLLGGGSISSFTFGGGNTGHVAITADHLASDAAGSISPLQMSTVGFSESTGTVGDITVAVGDLNLRNGAFIGSQTFGTGGTGTVRVTADRLDARGGASDDLTGVFSLLNSPSSGDAGAIEVAARESITLQNGATIRSGTSGSGNAGNVAVEAPRIELSGQGRLASIASDAVEGSSGSAGRVTAKAGALTVRDGAAISSSTFGEGDATGVAIQADSIVLAGDGSALTTGIVSGAEPKSKGSAGTIAVTAGDMTVQSGAVVRTSTFGAGNAGDIAIAADRLRSAATARCPGFPPPLSRLPTPRPGRAQSSSRRGRW